MDSSDSSSVELSSSENEVAPTPPKKKYRKGLHQGFSRRSLKYREKQKHTSVEDCFSSDDEVISCCMPHENGSFLDDQNENRTVLKENAAEFVEDRSTSISSLNSSLDNCSKDDSDSILDLSEFSTSSSLSSNEDDSDTCSPKDSEHYIFEKCKHTLLTSYMSVMLYAQKHSLSKEAFTDLLHLIASHLPPGTKYLTSIYKVKEFLKRYMSFREPAVHTFCERCLKILQPGKTSCDLDICRRKKAKVLEFHDLHLEDQLRDLFQDDTFCKLLKKRDTRNQGMEGVDVKSDICDGDEYKRMQMDEQPETLNLTFTLNTDGVQIFTSSKQGHLWPIYVAINELPVKHRFSKKYILPCFLYCQKEKPNMLMYMSPLATVLQRLYETGLEVVTSKGRILVKAQLLAASLDLPARAMVANMKQFNGKYGCSVCLDEGVGRRDCPGVRYWPYNPDSIMRTQDSWLNDIQETVASSEADPVVHGVKGASPLIVLRYIDLPKLFVIDWMHSVLLGVTKTLLKMWLDGTFKTKSYYVGNKLALLNQRLLNIQIPDYISREQRGLEQHAQWKASECREWLLHYSVPVLKDILPSAELVHYSLLVTAMFLLNKEQISEYDIQYSEQLLSDFCILFPELYGDYQQTMNVHLLKHLPLFVRLHGPLFATSCFGFESMNSHIKNMIHGTRFVNKQVGFAVAMTKAIPTVVKQWTSTDGNLDYEVKSLMKNLASKFVSDDGSETTKILGKKKEFKE